MTDSIVLMRNTFLTRIILMIFSLAGSVIIARLLGPDGKGQVALAMSWPFLLANFSILGMETSYIYFISRDPRTFPEFVKLSLLCALIAGGIGALAFRLISISINLFQAAKSLEVFSALLLPLYTATTLLNSVYIGASLLPLVNLISVVCWFFFVLFLLILLLVSADAPSLVLAGFTILQVLNILLLLGYSYSKGLFSSLSLLSISISIPEVLSYSLKTYPTSIAGLVHLRATILVLSFVSPVQEIGIYSVAQSIIEPLLLLPVVVSTVLLPRVVSITQEERARITTTALRLSFYISATSSLAVGMISIVLIPIIWGPQFQASIYVVLALMPASCAYSIAKVLSTYFNGINRPALPSIATTVGIAVLILFTILLSPSQGALGAAFAMSISYTVLSLWLLAVYVRSTKVSIQTVVLLRWADIQLVINALIPSHLIRGIKGWFRP